MSAKWGRLPLSGSRRLPMLTHLPRHSGQAAEPQARVRWALPQLLRSHLPGTKAGTKAGTRAGTKDRGRRAPNTPRKPRIVVTVTVDSTLNFMDIFIPLLATRGWDVHVVTSPGPKLDAYRVHPGITVHELAMQRSPHPSDAQALANWVSLLNQLRPEVIFAASPKASMLAMLAGRAVRVPVRVYSVIGLRLETATGKLLEVLKRTEKLTVSSATHVLSVSESISAALPRYGINKQCEIIGKGSFFGFDPARFPRSAHTGDPSSPVIGFVGRLQEDKGVRELVDAFKRVRQEIPGAKLLVAGPDEGCAHLLEELPEDSYTWLGRVSDPTEVYHHCDVFCLPTYREGFGIVVCEAQACGVPVVTTDATGAINAADYGRTARVARVRDSESLFEELMVVLTDEDERERLRTTGLEWARNFDRRQLSELTEKWLREVLIDSQRRRAAGRG